MEKVAFSGLIHVVHWYHEADMTDVTWFFDRTDGIIGILLLQETHLSWVEVILEAALGATGEDGRFFLKEAENIHLRSPYAWK